MDIKTFCKTYDRQFIREVAEKAGTNYDHLRYQLVGGHRKASHKLAIRLVKASRGILTLHGIRPDIWDK